MFLLLLLYRLKLFILVDRKSVHVLWLLKTTLAPDISIPLILNYLKMDLHDYPTPAMGTSQLVSHIMSNMTEHVSRMGYNQANLPGGYAEDVRELFQ